MEETLYCRECGQEFIINDEGIAFHVDESGRFDRITDADHAPLSNEQVEFLDH